MLDLGNISMVVRNIEKSVRFYSNVLDFNIVKQKRTLPYTVALLQQGSIVLELIQYTKPESDPRINGVIDHVTFTVNNLKETVEKLKRQGIEFETAAPLQAFDGSQIIFLRGPDSERIALISTLGR